MNSGTSHLPFRVFLRENTRPAQIAMLLAATAAGIGGIWFFSIFAVTAPAFVVMAGFRWGLGEFLWCWMAADHCFTTIGHLRESARLRDWRLTLIAPREITGGLIRATTLLLAGGIALWFIADLIELYPERITARAGKPGLFLLWWIGFPLAMAVSHLATAWMAAAWCTRAALRREMTPHWRWAGALASLSLILFGLLIVILFAWVRLTINPRPADAANLAYIDLIEPLYHTSGMATMIFLLLVFTLPVKIFIAMRVGFLSARLMESMEHDEI